MKMLVRRTAGGAALPFTLADLKQHMRVSDASEDSAIENIGLTAAAKIEQLAVASRLGEVAALEYAMGAILEFEQQYTQVEMMDQINRHFIQKGDLNSLKNVLDSAKNEPLAYKSVRLTASYLVRTGQPFPPPLVEWLKSCTVGKIPKPKHDRRSRRALPGANFERDRAIHQIVSELEERGVPRSETVNTGFFFGYEIVAKANRNLGKKPTSASRIREIWERREREIKTGRNAFSQIDLLTALK